MAFLFRPTYKDKKTGKPKKTRKWYAGGVLDPATGKTKRVPLCADKTAAQAMLADLLRNADKEAAGIGKPKPKRALPEAIRGWQTSLEAKSVSVVHKGITVSNVTRTFAGQETVDQITAAVVEKYLAGLAESGRSVQTRNLYLSSAKAFCNWLVAEEWIGRNPLSRLRKSNTKKDRRHDRRALPQAQFAKLLQTASESTKTVRGLAGKDRRMLYLVAASTGFRRSELAALTPSSFLLGEPVPAVRGKAAYAKDGQDVTQPLPPSLVEPLRAYVLGKPKGKRVWGGNWHRRASELMIRDLKDAGIPYKTDEGFADFHALRTLYITGLFRGGVHPKVAQALARHSTIELTMQTYTKVASEQLVEGVAKLWLPTV